MGGSDGEGDIYPMQTNPLQLLTRPTLVVKKKKKKIKKLENGGSISLFFKFLNFFFFFFFLQFNWNGKRMQLNHFLNRIQSSAPAEGAGGRNCALLPEAV